MPTEALLEELAWRQIGGPANWFGTQRYQHEDVCPTGEPCAVKGCERKTKTCLQFDGDRTRYYLCEHHDLRLYRIRRDIRGLP